MREEEVDEVVLVGGTTRIPRVKRQLRCVGRRVHYVHCTALWYSVELS